MSLDRLRQSAYLAIEAVNPPPALTDAQRATVLAAVAPAAINPETWRPNCTDEGCTEMPVMLRVAQGYRCPSCGTTVNFALGKIPSRA